MRRLTPIPGVGAITAASVKALIPIPAGSIPAVTSPLGWA
ncbi:hypothetical protein SAMCFNEI73_pB0174 (plasmid) [Sinorhizobium americanum]|uniref:Transposase n=1 Tax=Sinorhizobium americanum TaxID=194963 RepID=A0A1L3LTH0_9HYPH|nr:hypothetical protein SAMCFNEI73_pB0174 [Sinorhizobium americanum]